MRGELNVPFSLATFRKLKFHTLFCAAFLTIILSDDAHNTLTLLSRPFVTSAADLVPNIDPLRHRASEV